MKFLQVVSKYRLFFMEKNYFKQFWKTEKLWFFTLITQKLGSCLLFLQLAEIFFMK